MPTSPKNNAEKIEKMISSWRTLAPAKYKRTFLLNSLCLKYVLKFVVNDVKSRL